MNVVNYHFMRIADPRLLLCALALSPGMTWSAETIGPSCPIDYGAEPDPSLSPPQPAIEVPGIVQLRGNRLEASGSNITELSGNAEVARDGQQIRADSLRYDRETGQADAKGNVVLMPSAGGRFITGEAHMNLDTRTGFADGGTYYLAGSWGRGDMGRVEFDKDTARLSDARFTTCPDGQDDWFLRARRIDIDNEENIAVARGVTLNFLGAPVLYLPYLSFPVSDERKTGFLMPEIGYDTYRGTIIGAPYYVNLAPSYDATLTPRVLTKRGLQLETEFRYLGENHNGVVTLAYLPDDEILERDRTAGSFNHRHSFSPRWSGNVHLRAVSDKDYVTDFGDSLTATTETHLPQIAEVNYRGPIWDFTGRIAGYQTVDRSIAVTDRPYARLPQLLLNGELPSDALPGMRYRLNSELVNFERPQGVTGQRVNLNPSVALNAGTTWGFVAPEFGLRHIQYNLNDTIDTQPSVSAPFFALDSGIFLDRPTMYGATRYTQTLEPRLYYLYVPYREQGDLPNFDTNVPDLTFANLFRSNRLVGGDRIADANQLTLALTTRFLRADDGRERLRASVGRIHYFNDRRINVPAGTIEDSSSDVVAEAVAWLPRNWHIRTNVQWTPELDSAARGTFYLQHQPSAQKIVNVGYRLQRDALEQTDVSVEWPLRGAWTVLGRSIYSVRDNENVESYVGIKYSACCWAARLFVARRLTQTTSQSENLTEQRANIHFQLELAGLARAGTAPESPLRQGLFSFPRPTP
jgi:LPS-assembly protein